jgi:hypothetical protein
MGPGNTTLTKIHSTPSEKRELNSKCPLIFSCFHLEGMYSSLHDSGISNREFLSSYSII